MEHDLNFLSMIQRMRDLQKFHCTYPDAKSLRAKIKFEQFVDAYLSIVNEEIAREHVSSAGPKES